MPPRRDTNGACAALVSSQAPVGISAQSQLTAAACTRNKKQELRASHKGMVRTQRSGMRQRSVQDLACGFPSCTANPPLFRISTKISHLRDARRTGLAIGPLLAGASMVPMPASRGTCPGKWPGSCILEMKRQYVDVFAPRSRPTASSQHMAFDRHRGVRGKPAPSTTLVASAALTVFVVHHTTAPWTPRRSALPAD